MDDVIRINDQWYVLAGSSRADDRTRALKQDETFALFDRYGDIQHIGIGEQGLYHAGTRYLSHFELSVDQRRPLLLNSGVHRENRLLTVDLTTPDLYRDERLVLPKGTLHIFRAKLLWQGVEYEHLRVTNFGQDTAELSLDLAFAADYADIFEVRGMRRPRRGRMLPTRLDRRSVRLGYRGLDGVTRETRIEFSRPPDRLSEQQAGFDLRLEPHAQADLYISVGCLTGSAGEPPLDYAEALAEAERACEAERRQAPRLFSSNEQFNDWINRSAADLDMLVTQTPEGPYPYAGIPWFSTAFGRDGLITALQTLWLQPGLARGVLSLLAATQAREDDPERDAEPGKILHEMRQGEMAALGEIPFDRYYGTIDATPLFVMLAGEYLRRTGDLDFIRALWPAIDAALGWMAGPGDPDGDGFLEYRQRSAKGLVQQGWKDSNDSIFHADGRPARGPIALCEVQGYAYRAWRLGAEMAAHLGLNDQASLLSQRARRLRQRFDQAFWCEDIGSYAIALDGDKQPCRVPASNAGHALYCGIAEPERAEVVARTLLSPAAFSGWGVRTIAAGVSRYNPMSYHNGSIWPHDNAIIAAGLARYDFKEAALRILTALFNASIFVDINRLPELFCGFDRLPGQGPTLYPVACSPQAWAAGSVFMLLQAVLGLSFAMGKPQIRFQHPRLPDYIERLRIEGLRIGDAEIDLRLRRHENDVGINILRKTGDIEVTVVV